MSNICVIGAGCVGLVTAAAFAELGHRITVLDIDLAKVRALKRDILPVCEPQLGDLWKKNRADGNIQVTGKYEEALHDAEFAFITVGTPSARNGKPNIKSVRQAARQIAASLHSSLIVIIKSTVPLGTSEIVADIIKRHNSLQYEIPVISNPDFMRKGTAVVDFMHPFKVVIGGTRSDAVQAVAGLYEPLGSKLITCDNVTAEMSKYATNVYRATRVGFMNEIALICDEYGADIIKVTEIIGKDPRTEPICLDAGIGWGGSDILKDFRGLMHTVGRSGILSPLLSAVNKINQRQPRLLVKKLTEILGTLENRTIGILGLVYSPDSDEIRDAPSLAIISLLKRHNCMVRAYDPLMKPESARIIPGIAMGHNAYETATGCDALLLVTEWDEFKGLDYTLLASRMKRPVIVDGRNFLEWEKLKKAGFVYRGIGIAENQKEPFSISSGGEESPRELALLSNSRKSGLQL